MKHFLIYIGSIILCATLTACKHRYVIELTEQYSNQEIINIIADYKPYFSVYEVGDSVVFMREDSTIDVYYVSDRTECWRQDKDTTIMSMGIDIYLQQNKRYIHTQLTVDRYGGLNTFAHIYNELDATDRIPQDWIAREKDDIIIYNNAYDKDLRCVLRRNVGLVYVQDGKHHTWTTILPAEGLSAQNKQPISVISR